TDLLRLERAAILLHVIAILQRRHDGRVRRWTANAVLFERLDERRFRVPWRRLSKVLVRLHAECAQRIANSKFRQRLLAVLVLGITVSAFNVKLPETWESQVARRCTQHVWLVPALD